MHARHRVLVGRRTGDEVVHHALVARHAVGLQDATPEGLDVDRLVEVLEREAVGVPHAVLGLGEEDPNADNKTRDGRKAARRVEIKVFALELGSPSATTANAQE